MGVNPPGSNYGPIGPAHAPYDTCQRIQKKNGSLISSFSLQVERFKDLYACFISFELPAKASGGEYAHTLEVLAFTRSFPLLNSLYCPRDQTRRLVPQLASSAREKVTCEKICREGEYF